MKFLLQVALAMLLSRAGACAGAQDLAGCSEHFDAVAVPALPDGWRSAGTAHVEGWSTAAGNSDNRTNAAHLADHGVQRYEAALLSPVFVVPTQGTVLRFRQRRAYSWANTVGVLEISIAGGAFTDIAASGGEFLEGPYDGRSFASNPLGPRRAWIAKPEGYTETRVRLPAAARGKTAQLRFRAGSTGTGDDSPGWYLDSIACSAP